MNPRRGRRGTRGSSGGTVAVDPLNLSPLALWRENITTGATFTWSDLTGNGNHLVQASAPAQPTKNASSGNLNGQPSISFGGAAFLATAGNLALTTIAAEIWIVGKITSGATNRIVCELGNASSGTDTLFIGYNWTAPASTGPSGLIHSLAGNNWQAFNDPNVFCTLGMVMDKSTNPDSVICRVGSQIQTVVSNAGLVDGSNNYGANVFAFGGRVGGVNPITAEIGMCAVWNRVLTTAERQAGLLHCALRFGVSK